MKKEVKLVIRVYREILMDISAYAGNCMSPTQDLMQLEKLINTRGLRVVYQDFPSAMKLVDRSLSDGCVNLSELRRILGSMPKTPLPRLFNQLWVEIYDEDGNLSKSVDPNNILFVRQLLGMFKKIVRPCSDQATNDAIAEFVRLDQEIGREYPGTFRVWEDPLTEDLLIPGDGFKGNPSVIEYPRWDIGSTRRLRQKFGLSQTESWFMFRVFSHIANHIPVPSINDLIPNHGRGAVAGMSWGDKYSFPDWSSKLNTMFPMEEFAIVNYGIRPVGTLEDIDIPVKILAVPKTMKGPRIIGAESVSRMYCQQSLLWFLRKHIPSLTFDSVDISNQTKSQVGARAGSIDGLFATIDLSSASDRLSLALVEELFAHNEPLLRYLAASRATTYDVGDGPRKLEKFAHQGSAVTFPVQSLAYYAICLTAVLIEGGYQPSIETLQEASYSIRVYGDDIIVPTFAYQRTCDLLTACGMKVNRDKSHGRGFFREACGIDAYKGIDVTPTYIRDLSYDARKPESIVRFVEVGNNLHKAGFWHASCGLFSARELDIPVTQAEQVPLAHFSFSQGCQTHHLKVRYNSKLHRYEMKSLVPTTVGTKRARDNSNSMLQFFIENPAPDSDWKSGFYGRRPKTALRRKWNYIPA